MFRNTAWLWSRKEEVRAGEMDCWSLTGHQQLAFLKKGHNMIDFFSFSQKPGTTISFCLAPNLLLKCLDYASY